MRYLTLTLLHWTSVTVILIISILYNKFDQFIFLFPWLSSISFWSYPPPPLNMFPEVVFLFAFLNLDRLRRRSYYYNNTPRVSIKNFIGFCSFLFVLFNLCIPHIVAMFWFFPLFMFRFLLVFFAMFIVSIPDNVFRMSSGRSGNRCVCKALEVVGLILLSDNLLLFAREMLCFVVFFVFWSDCFGLCRFSNSFIYFQIK